MLTLREAVVSTDPTWDNTGAAIWSVVELNCSILCSSLPTLRPLLARIIPGLGSSFKSRGYQHYGSARTDIEGTKRRGGDKASDQSGSTEQLAMGAISGQDPQNGVYAVCTADVRFDEESLELGSERGRKGQNGIMVTTETSIGAHPLSKR